LHKQQNALAAPALSDRALKIFYVRNRPLIGFSNHIRRLETG
jgi:hypothetical protein